MVRCRKCGQPMSEKAKVCIKCGTAIRRTSVNASIDSYDRYRKQKMRIEMHRKRRKRRIRLLIFWALIFAIAGAVAGGFYVNHAYKESVKSQEAETEKKVNSTEKAETDNESTTDSDEESVGETATEKPEKTDEPLTSKNLDSKAEDYGCSVYEDASYEFKCAYPSEFIEGTLKNNNTRVSYKDEDGDGNMLIGFEKISKSKTVSDIMEQYINQCGVDPDRDTVKDNSYTVTYTRVGSVHHRKGVVYDEKHVYYEFIFEEGSDSRKNYEEYIDFLDLYLQEMNKPSTKKTN